MINGLYDKNSANCPRIMTDCHFVDYNNNYKYEGIMDDTFQFVCNFQLLRKELWQRFVHQFHEKADCDEGWRGEYWGKMMRGAYFVYSYLKEETVVLVLMI